MAPSLAPLAGWEPIPRFLTFIVLYASLGTVNGCISAAGEEIGWRGHMLMRLIAARVPQPLFISGLIWAVWHFPSFCRGPTPPDHSRWPAIVLHGAWNSIIQEPFDRSSVGRGATLWVGEFGVLVAVMTLIVGVIVYQWWKKDGAKSAKL
jgi:hypothetical protein